VLLVSRVRHPVLRTLQCGVGRRGRRVSPALRRTRRPVLRTGNGLRRTPRRDTGRSAGRVAPRRGECAALSHPGRADRGPSGALRERRVRTEPAPGVGTRDPRRPSPERRGRPAWTGRVCLRSTPARRPGHARGPPGPSRCGGRAHRCAARIAVSRPADCRAGHLSARLHERVGPDAGRLPAGVRGRAARGAGTLRDPPRRRGALSSGLPGRAHPMRRYGSRPGGSVPRALDGRRRPTDNGLGTLQRLRPRRDLRAGRSANGTGLRADPRAGKRRGDGGRRLDCGRRLCS
jgi:hypothetical protein